MAEYFFENMTIGQLRKLTEDYKKLQDEVKILRAKYPTKVKKDSAEDIIQELEGGKN